MGIPSFYKHLIQSITGITSKDRDRAPKLFGLDLNCAIYHCVHKLQKRFPYTPEQQSRWEAELIDAVIAYIKHLRTIVKPTEMLYIGVDGVAPMAKIKQQRMRRFKSAVTAEDEARIKLEAQGKPANTPLPQRWDTNAITPGTAFMANLAIALRRYEASEPTRIVVSPADQPGEGEQKLMEYIRTHAYTDIVIYGLDADLIVLAVWHIADSTRRIDLFREETEFSGGIKENALGEEQFLYLDIAKICNTIMSTYAKDDRRADFLHDFVGIMNLLGNDFVPHGLSVKIKSEGIEILLEMYKNMDTRENLVVQRDDRWEYNVEVLRIFAKRIAEQEPAQILKAIRAKLEARVGASHSKSEVEQALARYNDTPVEWAAEKSLIRTMMLEGRDKPVSLLVDNWRDLYDEKAFFGTNPNTVVTHYLESLAWTLTYYSGGLVDTHWYFPWPLPPRFETVVVALENRTTLSIPNKPRTPLKPQEQLAMVLPQPSFGLLPAEYAKLMKDYPQYWPTRWASYSFGRRFLWECEPLIPLVPPERIRTMIEQICDT